MDISFRIISFIKHWLTAGNAHGLHSPFVFDLYCEEISIDKKYYNFNTIESLKNNLLIDNREINLTELGSGIHGKNLKKNKIRNITSSSVCNQKTGELLFKLCNRFQPKHVLEIGTSFGISTLYLALGNTNSKVFTIEGDPARRAIALETFTKARAKNIESFEGNFNEVIPTILNKIPQLDLVYFDGNHKFDPTIQYFNWCLEKSNENSVFIFDDIYLSKEMNNAWKKIITHERVMISIDLYDLGLIFFRKNQPKQHFCLKF